MSDDDDQRDLFDLKEGIRRKNKALAKVLENAGPRWVDKALAVALILIRPGEIVTGEDIRLRVLEIIEPPHHHNVWGALTNALIRRKALIPTGRFVQMQTKTSHARMTQQYRRALREDG